MPAVWNNISLGQGKVATVPLRLYSGSCGLKTPPLILYLSGGSFLNAQGREEEAAIPRAFAERGAVVIEADYSMASRNLFPQAVECALAALTGLSARRKLMAAAKSPLIVAGDEAGGNIAAGVALKARDMMRGELAGQILLSPMIDPSMSSASFREADRIGMRERWSNGWSHYLGPTWGFSHPYAAPCLCSRLVDVAPAVVFTSQDDPLHDEAVAYARRLSEAGVKVREEIFPAGAGWTGIYGMQESDCIAAMVERCAEFIRELRS